MIFVIYLIKVLFSLKKDGSRVKFKWRAKCAEFCKVYATETYIMHFLEFARFLHAPHLAGRKVKGYFMTCCWSLRPAVGAWALKPLFSYLHKNTNEPVFLYGAWPL